MEIRAYDGGGGRKNTKLKVRILTDNSLNPPEAVKSQDFRTKIIILLKFETEANQYSSFFNQFNNVSPYLQGVIKTKIFKGTLDVNSGDPPVLKVECPLADSQTLSE